MLCVRPDPLRKTVRNHSQARRGGCQTVGVVRAALAANAPETRGAPPARIE